MKTFLEMGVGGSFLILLVLIFRRFLSGRVPRRFLVFLWLCVIMRLLLPFSVPVKWTPTSWADRIPLVAEQLSGKKTSAGEDSFYSLDEGTTPKIQPVLTHPAKAGLNTLFYATEIIWLIAAISLAAVVLFRHVQCLKRYRMSLPVAPRDMELACDEEALAGKGLHFRKSYALLLLRLADNQRTSWLSGACFIKHSEMEERICEIMKKKHYTWTAAFLAAVVVICMIPAFISISEKGAANQTDSGPAAAPTLAGNGMEPQVSAKGSSDSRQMVEGADIVRLAKDYIGNPFRTFGSDLESGVDSSGFVKEIYKLAGIELPHSTEGLLTAGTEIDIDKIADGDLILYGKENENHTISLVHAAIYIGDNQVIHASNAKDGVKLAEMDYRPMEGAKAVRILE